MSQFRDSLDFGVVGHIDFGGWWYERIAVTGRLHRSCQYDNIISTYMLTEKGIFIKILL